LNTIRAFRSLALPNFSLYNLCIGFFHFKLSPSIYQMFLEEGFQIRD
jgi:hypothetical protein